MTSPEQHKPTLLIVDDDPLIIDTLSYVLGCDFDIIAAHSRADCVALLRSKLSLPQLALVDLGLPPLPHQPDEGFALISDLLAHSPNIGIVVLSGQNDETNARHARTLGATEFIAKPADPDVLRQTLQGILACQSAEQPVTPMATQGCALLGNSAPIQALRAQIRQYADSPFPVLVEGESGSGKEIIASCCLHRMSSRGGKPYFALNCAAISPNLLEATLFGHARGAFTGADKAKPGYFEDAEEGVLFLDEIGELPLELQPKLLRVLENGEFQRVGETQTRISRARVIAATNRDLRKEVREGRFRADLYHRLSVFAVDVPPLREMGDDKILLLHHFRKQYAEQAGQLAFELSDDALRRWQTYSFPGNVRELRNIAIRLTAKYPGRRVGAAELEDELESEAAISVRPPDWLPPQDADELFDIALRQLQQHTDFDLASTLLRWEHAYIQAALRLAHGNVSKAARLLGVNRSTLYNRMEVLERDLGHLK